MLKEKTGDVDEMIYGNMWLNSCHKKLAPYQALILQNKIGKFKSDCGVSSSENYTD